MKRIAYTFTGTKEGAVVKIEDGREVRVDMLEDGYAHLSVSRPINGVKCTTGMGLSHAAREVTALCLLASLDLDTLKRVRRRTKQMIKSLHCDGDKEC